MTTTLVLWLGLILAVLAGIAWVRSSAKKEERGDVLQADLADIHKANVARRAVRPISRVPDPYDRDSGV